MLIAFFFLFIQNLFQYFASSDKAFIYYAIYILLTFLIYLQDLEINYIDFPILFSFIVPYQYFVVFPLYNIAFLFYYLFAMEFLESKKYPKLHLSLQIMIGIIISYIILDLSLSFIFAMPSVIPIKYFHYFMAIYSIGMLIYTYILKIRLANFIIAGSFFLMFFGVLGMLLIYTVKFPLVFPQLGILIELVIFSMGLAYKAKLNKEEKEKSQEALILQLEKNDLLQTRLNEELQLEVDKKTKEILIRNKEIQQQREATLQLEFNNKLAESELKAFKSQMNPHFIFNGLNSIKGLISRGKYDESENYISKFSKLLRQILNNSETQQISLKDEIEICRIYLEIESLRFDKSFKYIINVKDNIDLSFHNIPSLILQPYLENAIWHGLLHKEGERSLEINIKKHLSQNAIICSIEDNGIGREKAAKHNSINKKRSFGMSLSKERLLRFNPDAEIQIIDKKGIEKRAIGTKINITLPY